MLLKALQVLNVEYCLTSQHLRFRLLSPLSGRRICGFWWPTDQPLRAATVVDNLGTIVANELNKSKQNPIKLIGSRSNHTFNDKD